MSIDVNWSALEFKGKSKRIVSSKLQIFMWRFRPYILQVQVRFSDVNGPKGGMDKRCTFSAEFSSPGDVTIISEGMEYIVAFQSGLARLVRSVHREIAKQREKPIRINRRIRFIELEN
jgi:putative sigma-54 modulation protein